MQFCARFNLKADDELIKLSKEMIYKDALSELSIERIHTEFKKLFLKSSQPSLGFNYLQKIDAFKFFSSLEKVDIKKMGVAIDRAVSISKEDIRFEVVSAVISSFIYKVSDIEKVTLFLKQISGSKKLNENILTLTKNYDYFKIAKSDYELYKIATKLELYKMTIIYRAIEGKECYKLESKIKELGIEKNSPSRLVEGKDLIKLGLVPSKEFSRLLERLYDEQLRDTFKTKKNALVWLKENLL